ncbi:hypothetical protein CDIK_2528 [Cucumispora dikerogammari]|nr:hypothetical protein CDIK_2528 [Cucumispora dikerogammari]
MDQNETQKQKRTTITKDIIKIIRKLLNKEYNIIKCAEEAEISYKCAYDLIKKITRGDSDETILGTKKERPSLLNNPLKNKARHLLTEDPTLTLNEIKDELAADTTNVSITSISRTI